jgi:hypothetical protein
MPTTNPSIKIVKAISWKGTIQEWSNRYYFDGAVPSDEAHWTTLADAIVAAEQACFKSFIPFNHARGYDGATEIPVFQKDYAVSGTNSSISGDVQAAEVAALVRYTTAKRTSKNHPVYLFNYYHGVVCTSSVNPDWLETTQKTALSAYAAQWLTGFSDGSVTHKRCGPDGTAAILRLVESYVTHRDFR